LKFFKIKDKLFNIITNNTDNNNILKDKLEKALN